MNRPIVQSTVAVALVGGGPVSARDLTLAKRYAPVLVAADSGADRLLRAGLRPAAVIGDLDSVSAQTRAALDPATIHHLAEQDTTDFDKALRSIEAPLVLAFGFAGARIDHGLAVFNALVRHERRACIVVGPQDVVFAAPACLRLRLRPGDRVSLFPMAPVQGRSTGLHWPIDGLTLAPDGMIGTSNLARAADVTVQTDGPGLLVILPRNRLAAAMAALSLPDHHQR